MHGHTNIRFTTAVLKIREPGQLSTMRMVVRNIEKSHKHQIYKNFIMNSEKKSVSAVKGCLGEIKSVNTGPDACAGLFSDKKRKSKFKKSLLSSIKV